MTITKDRSFQGLWLLVLFMSVIGVFAGLYASGWGLTCDRQLGTCTTERTYVAGLLHTSESIPLADVKQAVISVTRYRNSGDKATIAIQVGEGIRVLDPVLGAADDPGLESWGMRFNAFLADPAQQRYAEGGARTWPMIPYLALVALVGALFFVRTRVVLDRSSGLLTARAGIGPSQLIPLDNVVRAELRTGPGDDATQGFLVLADGSDAILTGGGSGGTVQKRRYVDAINAALAVGAAA